jgi:hypothetical protein
MLAFACTSESVEVEETQEDNVIVVRTFEKEEDERKVDDPQAVLQKRYQVLLEKYGPAQVVGYGEIADNEWFFDFYPYATLLHDTLGWDFVMLANIESREGIGFVNELVGDVNASHPNYEKAIEIHKTVRLTDESNPSLVRQAFKETRDPNLSDAKQRELWFSMYEKGIHYRSGEKIGEELTEENFPRSYQISKMTGIQLERLAFIEYKMGPRGLKFLIENIPMWEHKKECLKIVLDG